VYLQSGWEWRRFGMRDGRVWRWRRCRHGGKKQEMIQLKMEF
jgi:hypothetical protein